MVKRKCSLCVLLRKRFCFSVSPGVHSSHVFSSPRGASVMLAGTSPWSAGHGAKTCISLFASALLWSHVRVPGVRWSILMPCARPYWHLIPWMLLAFLLPHPAMFPLVLSKHIFERAQFTGDVDRCIPSLPLSLLFHQSSSQWAAAVSHLHLDPFKNSD